MDGFPVFLFLLYLPSSLHSPLLSPKSMGVVAELCAEGSNGDGIV